MTKLVRGNGIPRWPDALRQAALLAWHPTTSQFNPSSSLSGPAAVWRARQLENAAHGTRLALLAAGRLSSRS
jgi:hypothetical protein